MSKGFLFDDGRDRWAGDRPLAERVGNRLNLVMLVLLELPLIGYAVAPAWTPVRVDPFKSWFARNGRQALAIGAAVIGVARIVRGVVTLAG